MPTTITTPVAGFTGKVAGVDFTDGTGETDDDNALAYFRRHGYGVTEGGQLADSGTDPGPVVDEPPTAPAKNAPKAAWVDYAVALGMSRADAEVATKDELVAATADDGGEG